MRAEFKKGGRREGKEGGEEANMGRGGALSLVLLLFVRIGTRKKGGAAGEGHILMIFFSRSSTAAGKGKGRKEKKREQRRQKYAKRNSNSTLL